MEEMLREFFKNNKKKIDIKFLRKVMKVDSSSDDLFNESIRALEVSGEVIIDDVKHTIMAFPLNSSFIFGKIHISKNGNGFLEYDGKKYVVPSEYLDASMSGDLVLCDTYDRVMDGRYVATVNKVVKRKNDVVVATYDGDDFLVYGNKLSYPINVSNSDIRSLIPGDRVLLHIDRDINKGHISAQVIQLIGHKDDPNLDIMTIASSHNIPTKFSKATLEEVKNIAPEVSNEDLIGRVDYTNDDVVTIDCDSTKDMDDAVFVKRLNNGNYELDVHIAHVSHYVSKDSSLYKDAYERGNSTYMVDTVNPMIPHELSNGICSLNPGVIRLCRSTIMEISPSGEIVDFRLEKSFIKSRKKMNYSSVNSILEDNVVPEDYAIYEEQIRLMDELAKILKSKFEKNGLLQFASDEVKVNVDGLGKATSFVREEQRSAEELIEMFMISANICNAKHCSWNQIPTIYRVHGEPDVEKIYNTIRFISTLGYRIQKVQNVDNPKVIQGVLKSLKNYKEYPILSGIMLRGMQRANYSSNNYGHFALGLDYYAHSTSPIRRLADLEMQLALDSWEKYLEDPELVDFNSLEYELGRTAEHSSKTERNSDDAEEEANMMHMAEYMQGHIGEEFNAMIADIGPYGIFVKCNNEVKGKVNFSDIMGDYFEYDNEKHIVVGRKSKKQYHIGDEVIVKVKEASKEFRTVSFEMLSRVKKSGLTRELVKGKKKA